MPESVPCRNEHRLSVLRLGCFFRRSIVGRRIAGYDVYDIAFSPPRCRDFSATERWRLLLAYTGGDRAAVRELWR